MEPGGIVEAIDRVAEARRRLQEATLAYKLAVEEENRRSKDHVLLERYARMLYPDSWNLIDTQDSDAVYTVLNKWITEHEKQSVINDPVINHIVFGGPRPIARYNAHELTSRRLREKRSRIRLSRRNARRNARR